MLYNDKFQETGRASGVWLKEILTYIDISIILNINKFIKALKSGKFHSASRDIILFSTCRPGREYLNVVTESSHIILPTEI